jgi:DNA mismatch endonuclease (patch repair protein)
VTGDVYGPATRSAVMAAVKSRDTKPELRVRKLVRTVRTGYRLDVREVAGRPDIVFRRTRHAIFVHGCFWHGHDCARGARAPKANAAYWAAKVARNRARDAAALAALDAAGWSALVVWECALRDEAAVAAQLRAFLVA